MKPSLISLGLAAALLAVRTGAAETFDTAVKQTAVDYEARLRQAADELNRTRTRIADEKAPLLKQMRAAEDRIIAANSQIARLETGEEGAADQRRRLTKSLDAARKTTSYINTLVHDGAKAFEDGLVPGEAQQVSAALQELQQRLDAQSTAAGADAQPAFNLADFLVARAELAVGGYTAAGRAIVANGSEVLTGRFAFVGPATYFRPDQGGPAGAVWAGSRTADPVTYPLLDWKPEDAAGFFEGRTSPVVADVSGGSALRLKETKGTIMTHVDAGGLVAYLIIGVGFLAVLLIAQKIRDLARMRLNRPAAVRAFLDVVAGGSRAEMEQALRPLVGTTRELFAVGVQQAGQPKEILEDHLQAVLLRQQLHFERRLPLLAVIATASPLMGLLGTVVGMVKTFALITVFGTGNASKLASGISQVLVATELGLIVAIPTLIVHGFLNHRIQKNLALLERYALEFVTAVDTARVGTETVAETGTAVRSIPA